MNTSILLATIIINIKGVIRITSIGARDLRKATCLAKWGDRHLLRLATPDTPADFRAR